jgi:hypothetical protein
MFIPPVITATPGMINLHPKMVGVQEPMQRKNEEPS